MTKTRDVPCGSCNLCCRSEAIILHPEDGDDISNYETIVIEHPLKPGKPVYMIKPRESVDGQINTACRYLGPFGCSIRDKRPVLCREFDCRLFAKSVTPAMERVLRQRDTDGEWEKLRNRGNELLALEEK